MSQQDPYFVWMVLLHAAILIGAALEVVVLVGHS